MTLPDSPRITVEGYKTPRPPSKRLPGLHPIALLARNPGSYVAPPKVGRNDPCPGGCGQKAKRCVCTPRPPAGPTVHPSVPASLAAALLRDGPRSNGNAPPRPEPGDGQAETQTPQPGGA